MLGDRLWRWPASTPRPRPFQPPARPQDAESAATPLDVSVCKTIIKRSARSRPACPLSATKGLGGVTIAPANINRLRHCGGACCIELPPPYRNIVNASGFYCISLSDIG